MLILFFPDDSFHHRLIASDISDDDNDDISVQADEIVDIGDEHCSVGGAVAEKRDPLPDVQERLSPFSMKNSTENNKLKSPPVSPTEKSSTDSPSRNNSATSSNVNNAPSTSKPKIWSISEIIQSDNSSDRKSKSPECEDRLSNGADALRRPSILHYDSSLSWRSQC